MKNTVNFGSNMILWAVTAGLAVMSTGASAETIEKTIGHNKAEALTSIGAYDRVVCGSYPVRNVQITSQPAHGKASIIDHPVALGAYAGVCKGTVIHMKWLVYQPSANYAGADHVSVSWSAPINTGETGYTYIEKDFDITVK